MITKKTFIVLAMLGIFSGFAQATEEYQVVKVWPEVPFGWHFRAPIAVAVDNAGNVYVSDGGNHCIKKFDSKGRFITKWGSPGKGEGQFGWAHGIAIDGCGNLYVTDWDRSDWKHHRIQKFTTSGHFIEVWERNGPGVDKFNFPVDVAVGPKGNVFVLAQAWDDIKSSARVEKYSPTGEFITQWSTGCPVSSLGKIAVDTQENVYVAESRNHRIHKFDSNGKLLAAWGGSAEKEGRPHGGLLVRPRGIAFDASGNVYVVSHFDRVQKFAPSGQFIGTWAKGFKSAGDIALDNCGNAFVVQNQIHSIAKLDSEGNWLEEWKSAGQVKGPRSVTVGEKGNVFVVGGGVQKFDSEGKLLAEWGGFYWATIGGMAIDPWGNIYVNLDRYGSQEVHKLNIDGEPVKRWGSARKQIGPFQLPFGMAIDAAGNIYVADRDKYSVQKFSPEGKLLAKWGTRGSGEGQFQNLRTLTVDASGNVFVLDRPKQLQPETKRIQKFNTDGKLVTKWTVSAASGLAADPDGNVYCTCTDVNDGAIRKFDPNGELMSVWGKVEDANQPLAGDIDDICVDKLGQVYIVQAHKRCIKKFDSNGKFLARWPAEDKAGAYGFPSHPRVIASDGAGNLYLNDRSLRIWKLDPNGKVTAKFRMKLPSSQGRFIFPTDIAADGSGNVYVVDAVLWQEWQGNAWFYGKPRIQKFDADGKFIEEWEGPLKAEDEFKELVSVAIDTSGNAYVSDKRAHSILKLDSEGKLMKKWGSKGTGDGQFDMPEGIAVDKSGNVYVCDRQNCRIQKFDSKGRFLAKWGKEGSGEGEFHFPAAVALDQEGNVYVADSDNNRIQKFTAEGKFLTEWGEFGEAPGQFNVPLGIAVDAAGNVYVSDSHNHRIQKFAPVSSR